MVVVRVENPSRSTATMNGYRKSDIFVVPEKSSNKPVIKGAEKMEGRDVPKENRRRQNMLRTQRRESVLNELLLIHQKAKTDKEFHKYPSERFGVII
jgi:hypothetical protein